MGTKSELVDSVRPCKGSGLTPSEKETFRGVRSEVTYDLSYFLVDTLAIVLRIDLVEGSK